MFNPVPVEELAFAMSLFVGMSGRQPMSSGSSPSLQEAETPGNKLFLDLSLGIHETLDAGTRAALLNTVLASTFSFLWEHYKDDPNRESLCARTLGFYYLMERTGGAAMARWTSSSDDDPEHVELHPSVIEALAQVPLSESGALVPRTLMLEIESLCRTSAIGENLPAGEGESRAPGAPDAPRWPIGEGETAGLIRSRDWAHHPLGPAEHWPPCLRNAIGMTLACSFPMIILWRSNLVQFYNDAYRDLMGVKHPAGLGQPTRECWPEVWDFNEPLYRRVFAGETLTFKDQLYPILRYGFLEDVYFTLCYSPIRNESSVMEGVLVTVFETNPPRKSPSRRADSRRDRSSQNEPEPLLQSA